MAGEVLNQTLVDLINFGAGRKYGASICRHFVKSRTIRQHLKSKETKTQ
jgi:hypothetical protein